jgi:hypothetical protein
MRRAAWSSDSERERVRAKIAAAGSVGAWIRGPKPDADTDRAQHARLNALAKSCGMNPPYPEIENENAAPGDAP